MKSRNLAPRLLALTLSASLVLPSSVFALRQQGADTQKIRAGLEERLPPSLFQAGLEEPERLGFKLSLQTFGTWGSVRRILRGYNSTDQSSLRDVLYQMVRNIVRDGSVRAARYALSYGVPEFAKANVTVQELNEKLPSLERLAIALSKNPILVWRRVTREEFAELTRKALKLDAEGRSYVVQVFPKKVTYRSEEITRNTGNWDDNLQPRPGLYETDTIWHREIIPQSIILSPQNLESSDFDAAGLEENTPVKLTWRAWWATRRLWSETSKSLRLLSRENQWPARGLINGMLNRAVQKRVPTEYLLRFGVPVLLKPYQDMETLKNSLIGLERFNDRLAQAQKLVWEKISGGEYSRLTLEAALFNSQKSDYRIEVEPEESHGITRYWGPDGLLSEEQARGVEYSDGLSGSDYAPDKPPGYYYQNYMPVARVTERVIDSPQVVRLIQAGDMSGLEEALRGSEPQVTQLTRRQFLRRSAATLLGVSLAPAVASQAQLLAAEEGSPQWTEALKENNPLRFSGLYPTGTGFKGDMALDLGNIIIAEKRGGIWVPYYDRVLITLNSDKPTTISLSLQIQLQDLSSETKRFQVTPEGTSIEVPLVFPITPSGEWQKKGFYSEPANRPLPPSGDWRKGQEFYREPRDIRELIIWIASDGKPTTLGIQRVAFGRSIELTKKLEDLEQQEREKDAARAQGPKNAALLIGLLTGGTISVLAAVEAERSLKIFGAWRSVRKVLRGYGPTDQATLRNALYQMTRGIARDGSARAARYALAYGMPELAKTKATVPEVIEKLPSLKKLAIALSKNQTLVWSHVTREEFSKLIREALRLDGNGKDYVVQVFPQHVTYHTEERVSIKGNWDDNIQPYWDDNETGTYTEVIRDVIPQSILLIPQSPVPPSTSPGSNPTGLEEDSAASPPASVSRRLFLQLLGIGTVAGGGVAAWTYGRHRQRAQVEVLRGAVLDAVAVTQRQHRGRLAPEDQEALRAFAEAFERNPEPFDVWGLASRTLPPEAQKQGFQRAAVPVMGATNYRVEPDGAYGLVEVALDEDHARLYLQLAEQDGRYRDIFVGLMVREGTHARTLQDPDVAFVKRQVREALDLFTDAEKEEAGRALAAGDPELMKRSEFIRFLKQMGAVTVQIEYLGYLAQLRFLQRLGYGAADMDDMGRKSGLRDIPHFFPENLEDQRAVKEALLEQMELMGHPTVSGLKQHRAIEGQWDFLFDPAYYSPEALRETMVRLLKRRASTRGGLEEGVPEVATALESALAQGPVRAKALGITVVPGVKVGFDLSYTGKVGSNVRIEGADLVYFGSDGIWVRSGDEVGLFQDGLDVAAGTVISAAGLEEGTPITKEMAAGLQEIPEARLQSTVTSTNVPEIRVAVISAESAKGHPELVSLAGQPKQIGKGWLWVLPPQVTAETLSAWVVPFMGMPNVVFQEYGGLEEFVEFNAMVKGLASIQEPRVLTGTTLLEILRQIFANLSGLEEGSVTDEALRGVARDLGLGVQL